MAIRIDNGVALAYQSYLSTQEELGRNSYEVKVHDLLSSSREELVMAFIGSFEGLGFKKDVVQTTKGYLVLILMTDKKDKTNAYVLDRFDL